MTLRAQEDKIEDLQQFAKDLCDQNHYASAEIMECCQQVIDRRNNLWKASEARRKKLDDTRMFQMFLRNLYEVCKTLVYKKILIASAL